MDTSKRSKDLLIGKLIDMKMKQQEMGTVFIDEVDYIQTVYILRGSRLYSIDISSKQLKELEFTKKHIVLYANSNQVNQYLLILFKNGRIFAYSKAKPIVYFHGLKSTPTKESLSTYRIFSNPALTKVVILNNSTVLFWFKTKKRVKDFKQSIKEYQGETTSIDLNSERSNLIQKGNSFNEAFIALFDDSSRHGSSIKAYYILIEEVKELKAIKAYLVEYLLRFDVDSHFNAVDDNKDDTRFEYNKYFDAKYTYTYLVTSAEENELASESRDSLIMKDSISGKMIVIGVNLQKQNNAVLILFMCETYKFTSVKLAGLFQSKKDKVFIEDIGIICKDQFFIVQFKGGLFSVLNQNLQVVHFYEGSHYITSSRGLETLFVLNYFENNRLEDDERVSVLCSRTLTNFFVFYSKYYLILFQCHHKNFESRMFAPTSFLFDDFLLELKFSQTYLSLTENDHSNLLDNIHSFIFNHFNAIFKGEIEMSYGQNESLTNAIKFIINFIRIFRCLNQSKDVNQTLISYLICISNDFFFYLLSLKELWVSFLFIRLCEKYLLKAFNLRHNRNKVNDAQLLKGQHSFPLLNPYYSIANPQLKCYNKVANKALHSKLRLLLTFFALIEFRNNQALNINVLYFLLAKLSMNKLIRKKQTEDVVMVVKILIRNWKFLKAENDKAGSEEFVLNDLTLNYRTEALSAFLVGKTDRADIKLSFFRNFYTFDELHNFVELNETYCRGDEEALINEYGYSNNLGVIQKWILFFVNFFYNDMFADIKAYIDNHIKQTIANDIRKQTENISPEELDLSKIIYFNVFFGFMLLSSFLEKAMLIMSESKSKRLDENFNKKLISFVSPVDIPFLIFEFSYRENDCERTASQNEIVASLNDLAEGYFKEYNMTVQESLEYIEFIISKGFKHLVIEGEGHPGAFIPKIQIYLYSSLVFYLMSIVKVNGVALLASKSAMIIDVINSLNSAYRKGVYQLVLLIFTGYIKHYSVQVSEKTIGNNSINSFKAVLGFINEIYMNLLREEDGIRLLVKDFLSEAPMLLRMHFVERTLHFEYKTLREIAQRRAYDVNDAISMSSSLSGSTSFYNWLVEGFDKRSNTSSMQCSVDNIISAVKMRGTQECSMKLSMKASSINEIRKLILKNDCKSASHIDEAINRLLSYTVSTPSSNDQPSLKLIEATKLSFLKLLFLLHILYVRYSMTSISPKQGTIQWMKLFSYLIIFDKDSTKRSTYLMYLLDYINSSSVTKTSDKEAMLDICINAHYLMIMNKEQRSYNEKCSSVIKKTMKAIGAPSSLKYEKFISDELSTLVQLNDRSDLKHVNAKTRKLLILYTNDCFTSIIKQLMDNISSITQSSTNSSTNRYQTARDKLVLYHKAFCSLTGIPLQSRIAFNESFELTQNDHLLECILSVANSNSKHDSFYSSEYEKLLMDESRKACEIKPKSVKDQANSIEYDENEIIKAETSAKYRLVLAKPSEDKAKGEKSPINSLKSKPIMSMIKSIKRYYFAKLLRRLFYQFKSQMVKKELGEITFISIKPKEASFDSIMIKEKYLTVNELEQSHQDDLTSFKTYDIISLPKVKLGRSNKSKLLQELLKQTKATKLSDAIRMKVTELNDKVIQYEEMTKALGKQFVSDINK